MFSRLTSLQMKILLVFVCENHSVVHPKIPFASPFFPFGAYSSINTHRLSSARTVQPVFGSFVFRIEQISLPNNLHPTRTPLAFTTIYFLGKFKSSGPSSHLYAWAMTVNRFWEFFSRVSESWDGSNLMLSRGQPFRWKFINVSLACYNCITCVQRNGPPLHML